MGPVGLAGSSGADTLLRFDVSPNRRHRIDELGGHTIFLGVAVSKNLLLNDAMAKQQPHRHVLLQTRTIAAVGLISVGGGIGLALMLARTLISVGFAVALASELAVFWIYGDALRSLYRAVTKRIPYRGPGLIELALSSFVSVLMIGISIAVFSIALAEQPANVGNLSAERLNLVAMGHVRGELILTETLNKEGHALEDARRQFAQANPPSAYQLRPAIGSVISLQDIDPSTFPDILAKKIARPDFIQLTDEQWRAFGDGKSYIYVLSAASYEDDAHPGAHWSTSSCFYFIATTEFWHTCGPNQIDLVNSSGPR
jgi:hypothetical protein